MNETRPTPASQPSTQTQGLFQAVDPHAQAGNNLQGCLDANGKPCAASLQPVLRSAALTPEPLAAPASVEEKSVLLSAAERQTPHHGRDANAGACAAAKQQQTAGKVARVREPLAAVQQQSCDPAVRVHHCSRSTIPLQWCSVRNSAPRALQQADCSTAVPATAENCPSEPAARFLSPEAPAFPVFKPTQQRGATGQKRRHEAAVAFAQEHRSEGPQ